MKVIAKAATILGMAGAVAIMTPVLSTAQMNGSPADPWEHTMTPAPNGQCWIPNDRPYMEFGRGYWGACPKAAGAPAIAASQEGQRARAQAIRPSTRQRR